MSRQDLGTFLGKGLERSTSPEISGPGSIHDTRDSNGLSGSSPSPVPSGRLYILLKFSRTCIWPKNKSKYEPDLFRQEERFKPDTLVLCWPLSRHLSQLPLCRPALNWVNWEQWRGRQGGAHGVPAPSSGEIFRRVFLFAAGCRWVEN